MAYYDALKAIWPSVQGADTATKLAALNAQTVAGPRRDVAVHEVVAVLGLNGALDVLADLAAAAATSTEPHDAARKSARMLLAIINTPNAPVFGMSIPANYTAIKTMLDALLAQETAAAGSTGVTQTVHDQLMALCETTQPWWQANGYPRVFDMGDLAAAGLN